jgi:hypothetical protein
MMPAHVADEVTVRFFIIVLSPILDYFPLFPLGRVLISIPLCLPSSEKTLFQYKSNILSSYKTSQWRTRKAKKKLLRRHYSRTVTPIFKSEIFSMCTQLQSKKPGSRRRSIDCKTTIKQMFPLSNREFLVYFH